MNAKLIRFSKAFANESVKRIPYILMVMGVIIIAQSYRNGQTSAHNSQKLTNATQILLKIAEQTHQNSLDAKNNSERNTNYIDCLAQIFAKHTRDNLPVQEVDLNSCKVNEADGQTSATTSRTSFQPVLSNPVPSPNPTTPPTPTQSKISQKVNNRTQTLFERIQAGLKKVESIIGL